MKTIMTIGGEAERLMRDLTINKEPSLKVAKAQAVLDWIESAQAHLESQALGLLQEYGRHCRLHFGGALQGDVEREIADQTAEATRSKWAAVAFYMVELLASAMFFIVFIQGSIVLRLAAGASIAVLVGMAVTYLVIRHVRRDAEDQPDSMKARISWGLMVFGPPWLASVVGVLLVPRFGVNSAANWLFPVLTGIVTLLSPVLAAFCTAAQDVFGWSGTIVRKIDAVHRVGRRMHQLEQAARRVVQANKVDFTKGIVLPMILFFLLVCRGNAADLRLLVDVSPSVNRVQLVRTMDIFIDLLAANPTKRGIAIRVIPFFDNPWTAPEIAMVRLPPVATFECGLAPANELALISKAYAAAASLERESGCKASRERAEQKNAAERTSAIENMRIATRSLESLRFAGRCTAFYDAIRRATNQIPPAVGVIFSDATETCGHEGQPILAGGGRVFVVPVSSTSAGGRVSELFEDARKRLRATAAFVRVLEPYRMGEILEALR
jgi:hypothetical protein